MCLGSWSELGWVDSNALTAEYKESDPAQSLKTFQTKEMCLQTTYDSIVVRRSNRLCGVAYNHLFSLSPVTVCSTMAMIYVQQFFGSAVYCGCCSYRKQGFNFFAGGMRYLSYCTTTFLTCSVYIARGVCPYISRLILTFLCERVVFNNRSTHWYVCKVVHVLCPRAHHMPCCIL